MTMSDFSGILRRALFAGLLTLTASPVLAEDMPSVRVAVEGGFPPFNYLDAKNELQGFDIEIANALCQAGRMRCAFVIHTWDGIIPDLLKGQYDAIISSMSMSEERRKQVAFSQKYYTSPSIFITRKETDIAALSPEALKDRKIGVTFDTAQAAYVETFYRPGSQVTVFPKSPDLYEGLANGSVDVILEDKLAVFDWLTNTKAGQCCRFAGDDIGDRTYFGEGAGIALRPADTELRRRFDEALVQIQSDGTFDMINAKYFPFSIR